MNCPCCGSQNVNKFIEAYKISSSAWRSRTFKSIDFFHSPRSCNNCGHIFNSLSPTPKDLESYYLDQIPHIAEDYDTCKRISVIEEVNQDGNEKRILDFGGNSRLNFHIELEKRGYIVSVRDVGESAEVNDFDIITSYFVFEHLVDLDMTILELEALLTSEGKIIIEVPDATLYDADYSGLHYEHQQHFQKASLKTLMARHGFEEIFSSDDLCSRSFGFVSVFQQKTHLSVSFSFDKSIPEKYAAGRERQTRVVEYIHEFFNDELKEKKVICFWGANANLEMIFESKILQDQKYLVIDINVAKRSLIERLGYEFFTPSEFFDAYSDILSMHSITSNEVSIVITATAHSRSIRSQLDHIECDYLTFDPIG